MRSKEYNFLDQDQQHQLAPEAKSDRLDFFRDLRGIATYTVVHVLTYDA